MFVSSLLSLFLIQAPIAIVDARLEIGDGTVVEKGTVVIDGDRIVAVGASVRAPAGAAIIDGRGKVISPGIIVLNSQLGVVEVGLEHSTVDSSAAGTVNPAFRAADGFNPWSLRIPVDREEGVTAALVAPQGGLVGGQSFLVELDGDVVGAAPNIGPPCAMHVRLGSAGAAAAGGARGAALLRLREIFDDARFFQRNRAAYDRADARALSLPRVQLEALLPVLDGKVPMMVEVHRAGDILALLRFAAEQRMRVIVAGGAEAWKVAVELQRAQVPVVLMPSESGAPFSFDALAARDDNATVLHQHGVEVLIASWSTDNGTARARQEAGIAVSYGLPHEVAVRGITAGPGLLCGKKDVGVLSRGARAHVVLWSGDMLETTTVAERIWVRGRPVIVPSRPRQLLQRYTATVHALDAQPATK